MARTTPWRRSSSQWSRPRSRAEPEAALHDMHKVEAGASAKMVAEPLHRPSSNGGPTPLHATSSRRCLAAFLATRRASSRAWGRTEVAGDRREVSDLVAGKDDVRGGDILLELCDAFRPGDGDDVGMIDQPGERHLRRVASQAAATSRTGSTTGWARWRCSGAKYSVEGRLNRGAIPSEYLPAGRPCSSGLQAMRRRPVATAYGRRSRSGRRGSRL
jgi:hypothetical protein